MLSTREIAGLLWLGLLLLAVFAYGPTRRSIPQILRCFAEPPILMTFGAYLTWIGGGVYLASLGSVWNPSMAGPTSMWILLTGMPLIFGMANAATDARWLIHQLRALTSVTILLEFVVNIRTYHVAIEFALQGVLLFLVLMASVASIRSEYGVVEKTINWLLAGIGLALFCFALVHMMSASAVANWQKTVVDLLMPIWLGAWAAIFVAALGLFSNLERIFRLMSLDNPSWSARSWRILPLMIRVGLSSRNLCKYNRFWCKRLGNASGIQEANQVVSECLQDQADKESRRAAEAQRLIDHAGLHGTDERGAQLDQREFKETWDALETISLWFHGWYGRNTTGYDLAKAQQFLRLTEFKDLPERHGITMHVSPDGESCYAMRRTISGRVLAVGLHGHEFRHWHWDGDSEPTGYPGKGGDWGTDWSAKAFNPNR